MTNTTDSERIIVHLCSHFGMSETQAADMLPDFKKTLAQHMDGVEAALSAGDSDLLSRNAHTIKGAFSNLGLAESAALAATIEKGAAENDQSVDYAGMVRQLRTLLLKLLEE